MKKNNQLKIYDIALEIASPKNIGLVCSFMSYKYKKSYIDRPKIERHLIGA